MLKLWLLFRCCLSAAPRAPTRLVMLGPGTDFVEKLPIKNLIAFWADQFLIPAPHMSIVCAGVLHRDRRQGISYSSSWLTCYLKEKYLTRSLFEKSHTI